MAYQVKLLKIKIVRDNRFLGPIFSKRKCIMHVQTANIDIQPDWGIIIRNIHEIHIDDIYSKNLIVIYIFVFRISWQAVHLLLFFVRRQSNEVRFVEDKSRH